MHTKNIKLDQHVLQKHYLSNCILRDLLPTVIALTVQNHVVMLHFKQFLLVFQSTCVLPLCRGFQTKSSKAFCGSCCEFVTSRDVFMSTESSLKRNFLSSVKIKIKLLQIFVS